MQANPNPSTNVHADETRPGQGELLSQLPLAVPPGIERAMNAFRRDLPQLLEGHANEWVAYSEDTRISFGSSKTQLIQECLRRGFQRGDFVVQSIEPEVPREADLLPDV
jgi:hypothetical protein